MITVKARHIPNIITVLRILLVYPCAHYLLMRRYDWALMIFIVAGVSDAVDGFLARHFGWRSRLGSLLDPLADKALLLTCFIGAGWLQLIPLWLVGAVVLRDLIIVAGAVAYYLLHRPFDGQPHWTSKVNTFFQLLLIVAVLFHNGVTPLANWLLSLLITAVMITVLVSGLLYVLIWGRSYWQTSASDR